MKNFICITDYKKVQQWWFDDVLGAEIILFLFIFMIFPNF